MEGNQGTRTDLERTESCEPERQKSRPFTRRESGSKRTDLSGNPELSVQRRKGGITPSVGRVRGRQREVVVAQIKVSVVNGVRRNSSEGTGDRPYILTFG